MEKIKLGRSKCLLGENVRFDGGHKLDRFLTETLGHYVDYVPVCPEVECGLPVPREAMHLVGDPEDPRLITIRTGKDHTARMQRWAKKRTAELEKEGLCGFVFKGRSPSSGMRGVKIYNEGGAAYASGSGIFAHAFMKHFPLLPVEDEGRLHDPALRENFIERVFVSRRWREVVRQGMGIGGLIDFHSRHKLQLMAHSPKHLSNLGKLVAKGKDLSPDEMC